jgi:ABC-type sugar transport system ATPase subunit
VGYCPEERGIFSSLTAEENLMLPPTIGPGGMSMDDIYAMFPNLKERASSPGTRLSGGEQQMLAVARILRTGARLLVAGRNFRGPGTGHRAKAGRDDPDAQGARATPSCWWSRTSALPRPWRTAST